MKPSKADIFLMVGIILFSLSLYAVFGITSSKEEGAVAEISVNGKIYKTVSLSENTEITVTTDGHTNVIKIQNGSVIMTESDCHDKICVKQGEINKTGESIICLPNRVVVTVKGGKSGEYDAVAG